jgi:hypothetical protein
LNQCPANSQVWVFALQEVTEKPLKNGAKAENVRVGCARHTLLKEPRESRRHRAEDPAQDFPKEKM